MICIKVTMYTGNYDDIIMITTTGLRASTGKHNNDIKVTQMTTYGWKWRWHHNDHHHHHHQHHHHHHHHHHRHHHHLHQNLVPTPAFMKLATAFGFNCSMDQFVGREKSAWFLLDKYILISYCRICPQSLYYLHVSPTHVIVHQNVGKYAKEGCWF